MRSSLQQETEKLARSWMRHEPALLRDYLVADVEDPRLNVQSIISRQFLLTAVAGDRFQELMDQELRFAVAMNWVVGLAKTLSRPEDWLALADGLQRGADVAEGIEIPLHILRIHAALPASASGLEVPNYLREFVTAMSAGPAAGRPAGDPFGQFMSLWHQALSALTRPAAAPRVLEPACGSANDYRFLEASGLARLLDYSGFDLCEKNVQNARALFPAARIESGNVFDIAAPDKSVDYLFTHDLFEHLSLEGLETAAREVCRVTRQGLCLGFFNMDEIPDHTVRPVEDYHWNTLSVDRMRELFCAQGFAVQVVHIGSFLRWAAGSDYTHNPNAYTFLLRT
jgi:hypothetical protein